ncbi:MAG: arginase family protein [Nanoarchaeota archaeon]
MKLVKIPYSQGTDVNKGCEKAPDEIIKQLNDIWSNENFQDSKYEIIDSNLEELKDGDIFIGGDHSISYYIFKKFLSNKSNPGIIIFDAHPDLYQHFNTPMHEDWLYFLIEEKLIKPENVILIGIRNPDVKEVGFIKDYKIKYFTTRQLFNNLQNHCDTIMELARNFSDLYISIDIDVLDPAFAPGTGYIEPAGLSTRELIYLLQRIKLLKNIRKYDLVEVNPDKDFNLITCKTAAKIIKELI